MPPLNVNSRPQPAGARPPLLPITLLLLLLPQLEQGQGMPLLCPSSSSSSAPGLPTPSSASLPRHQKALPCFPSVSDAKAAFKRLRPILASWESSASASASTRHVEAPTPSQAKPWHAQAPGGLEVAVPLHGGHASIGPRWHEASEAAKVHTGAMATINIKHHILHLLPINIPSKGMMALGCTMFHVKAVLTII